MSKRKIYLTGMVLAGFLACQPLPVAAAVTESAAADSGAQTEDSSGQATQEVSAVLDFIRENWDGEGMDTREEVEEVISQGEQEFGFSLGDDAKQQLSGVILKLKELGVDADTAVNVAEKLYEKHGDALADNLQDFSEGYGKELAESAQKTLKEQVVEPVKEAAGEAVKETAKTFFRDLKNSVVSFFRNIFE